MGATGTTTELLRPALRDGALLRTKASVDGAWVDAGSGEAFPVADPATGDVLAEVPRMGAEDTSRAIEAAGRAQAAWARLLEKDRDWILRRCADLMVEHREDLAVLMVLEQGKPLPEARAGIGREGSKYGIEEWLELKCLAFSGISDAEER